MKTNRILRIPLLFAAMATTVGTVNALADSLSMIAPYGSDVNSSGRAIVYDAANARGIAVGQSWTGTRSDTTGTGLIWDAVNGTRWLLSSDNAGATMATGIGFRTTPGGQQLVVHGMTGSGHNLFSSMNSGVTWGPKQRFTSTYAPYTMGAANTLGTSRTLDPDGTSKFYYGFSYGTSGSYQLTVVTGSGGTTAPDYIATRTAVNAGTSSDTPRLQGVSGIGLSVGARGVNAYWANAAGNKGTINTLNGTSGEAWAISGDGLKIFGRSTVTDGRTGTYPWMSTGYSVPTANSTIAGTVIELPGLPGAVNYTANGLAYGASENGHYAVGMSYAGVEKAVLWDTVGNTVLDLSAYATGQGILDGFTRLSRAYSVYDAGSGSLWITGEGVWSSDGGVTLYTRGWVMNYVVPEPSTLSLAGFGLVSLLMFRRRS